MFLAEKGLSIPLVTVDLGKGEQHTDAYRVINPRRVVPTLVLAKPAQLSYKDNTETERCKTAKKKLLRNGLSGTVSRPMSG
jgi:hypothetical protein